MPECIIELPITDWKAAGLPDHEDAVSALENGALLVLPHLPFALTDAENHFLDPACVDSKTKSVKYALGRDTMWGHAPGLAEPAMLKTMLRRYAEEARCLIEAMFPAYAPYLNTGNTSFRPVEVEGRAQSPRQDDSRLHVDAFPSRPTGGGRLLRVFTNVHPGGRERAWRVGESFEAVAAHFLPKIAAPFPGSARWLQSLGLTKSRRSAYDHYMLQLHDRMKLDAAYQANADQQEVRFAPGASWIVFTDQVSHAAMAGQHAFEQTFTLPPDAMAHPEASPLRVLERGVGRRLI